MPGPLMVLNCLDCAHRLDETKAEVARLSAELEAARLVDGPRSDGEPEPSDRHLS